MSTTWDAAWLRTARRRLTAWYRTNARPLAWRESTDPYRVWVSEIMLQQTQVATVERYFPRFLEAFPDVAALAAAPEDRVLRLWEGLGYYRRARQMHAAAKQIVAEHDARFPSDPVAVRALPGIGRYTAGAILSIAFDARQPILEANTIRLFARLLAYRGDPASSAGQALLWNGAEAILPRRNVGHFNQALMELGSLVCTPRDPKCDACPLETLCGARLGNLQDEIPVAKRRPQFEDLHEAAVVVTRRGRVLLRKCAAGERWAGLWDFPRFALRTDNGTPVERQIADGVSRLSGIRVTDIEHFATLRHGVTRFRITLDAYVAVADGGVSSNITSEQCWKSARQLDDLPLSTTGRKLATRWQKLRQARKLGGHAEQGGTP